MRRVTIAVIGSGKTTRANVDALIMDVVESVDSAAIATVYQDKQSDGQVWAEQLADEKKIPWAAYARNDYRTLIKEHKDSEIKFFVLWDDEDPDCQLAASVAQENGILAYNLTDGLIQIPFIDEPIAKPVAVEIPQVEEEVSSEPVEPQLSSEPSIKRLGIDVADLEAVLEDIESSIEADSEDEPDEDDEEDENWDLGELLENAIEEAARHFARSFADEFKKHLGK